MTQLLTGYQELVLRGVGEGLTEREIVGKYGGSAVGNEIRRICGKLGQRNRIELMLSYLEEHTDPAGPAASAAWDAVSALPRQRKLLLAELYRISAQYAPQDMGDVRRHLQSRWEELTAAPFPVGKQTMEMLVTVLIGPQYLREEIKETARAVGLRPSSETSWYQLVRLYYLAVAHEYYMSLVVYPQTQQETPD